MSDEVINAEVTEILDAEQINVTRIFNAFNPREHFVRETWQFTGDSLRSYIPDAIAEAEFVVAHNGRMVPVDELETTYLMRGDSIVICPVPQKGGGKNVLGMIAMIAVSVFAPQLAGAMLGSSASTIAFGSVTYGALATVGITLAGSLLVHSIFAPSKPKSSGAADQTTSSSYGIDGPKNTSVEGLPVPVCYGRFRMAGNIIALYVQNDGDSQLLYVLINAGEGPIGNGIGAVKINGNDVSTYKDVEVDRRLGHDGQPIIPWFADTIIPHNVNVNLTDSFSNYTTSRTVDKFRVDMVAPAGLFEINKDDGSSMPVTVPLEIQYRVAGSNAAWTNMAATNSTTSNRSVYPVKADGTWGGGNANGPSQTGTGWTDPANPLMQTDADGNVWQFNALTSSWDLVSQGTSGGLNTGSSVIAGWRYTDNNQPVSVADLAYIQNNHYNQLTDNPTVPQYSTSGATNGMAMTSSKRSAVRASFTSPAITPPSKLEIRVRRTTTHDTRDTVSDQITWTDCNEILVQQVQYNNTGLLALKMRLGEQINGMPEITFENSGQFINVYGKPVATANNQWYMINSNNPAWIVWDILTNPRYGGALATSRLDFNAFWKWSQHCAANNLTFNGVIDTEQNVWDACQVVLRIGHAQLINVGTRYSVVVEQKDWPVQMFSVANMVRDSYKETWLSMTDRANEIEVTFFDATDDYKQRTIKVYDPAALTAGAKQKGSAITLIGCTDYERAYQEGMFMLNLNRYILKTVTFRAPIDALACGVGNLIYVQHDMPAWADAGRLALPGSQTQLKLDRPIVMEAGKSYKVLVHQDVIARYSGTIRGLVYLGNEQHLVQLSNYPMGANAVTRMQAVIAGVTRDFKVVDIQPGTGVVCEGLNGSNIAAGQTYTLFETDVIEERDVVLQPGTTDFITLGSWLSVSPPQFAKWMFGETQKLKQIFRIKSINMTGDDMTREIVAIQYDENIYDTTRYGAQHQTRVVPPSEATIGVVQNLTLHEQTRVSGNSFQTEVLVSWWQPQTGNYAGADVYVSRNGAPPSVLDAKSATSYAVSSARGETITARVVAYDIWGKRADYASSPEVTLKVVGEIPNLNVGDVTGADLYWSGADCILKWRYNAVTHSYDFGSEPNGADSGALDPHFKDYEIRVWHANDPPTRDPRRVEYTVQNHYEYTFDKNAADGISRRLRFEIRMRDIFNNLGEPRTVIAVNGVPGVLAINVAPSWETCQINTTVSQDPDFAGVLIWMSKDRNALLGDYQSQGMQSLVVYNGPNTNVLLSNLMFETTYYFRVAAYDKLGMTELLLTDVLSFTTGNLDVNAIGQGMIGKSMLDQNLRAQIDGATYDQATINNLRGQYTVKLKYVDSIGRNAIAGFGLSTLPDSGILPDPGARDPSYSEFGVIADKFWVASPSTPGVYPFAIGMVDGTVRVIMNSAIIGDATIKSAKIGLLEVKDQNIAGGAVSNVANLVTNAQSAVLDLGLVTDQTCLLVFVNPGYIYNAGSGTINDASDMSPGSYVPATCTAESASGINNAGYWELASGGQVLLEHSGHTGFFQFVFKRGVQAGATIRITVNRTPNGAGNYSDPMYITALLMKK